jgi:hypothetical protein
MAARSSSFSRNAASAASTSAPTILKTKASADHSSDFSDLLTMANAAASSGYSDVHSRSGSQTPAKRRKQDPKTGKGLRHFSMKVSNYCFT